MRRRRIILKVLLLLAAGAMLNVAVAWGCCFWSSIAAVPQDHWPATPSDQQDWNASAPSSLSAFAVYRRPLHLKGIGVHIENLWATNGYMDEPPKTNEAVNAWRWRIEAGWPAFGVRGKHWRSKAGGGGAELSHSNVLLDGALAWHSAGPSSTFRLLPFQGVFPGFAINTLFYAGVLWVMFCGPFALRRMIRRRRGQCPACAYPIGQSPVCTECGAAVTKASRDQGIETSRGAV